MSAFEYAMVLISIIVGLGITHVLSAQGFEWGSRPSYVVFWFAISGAAILGLITTRRWVHLTMGVALLLYNMVFTALDTPILGRW